MSHMRRAFRACAGEARRAVGNEAEGVIGCDLWSRNDTAAPARGQALGSPAGGPLLGRRGSSRLQGLLERVDADQPEAGGAGVSGMLRAEDAAGEAICAASRRRSAGPAARPSPPSPTRPRGPRGRAGAGCGKEDATAAATRGRPPARPPPGPGHATNTSSPQRLEPTASRARRGAGSCGWGRCRATSAGGCRKEVGETRAWTSTSMGREPSIVHTRPSRGPGLALGGGRGPRDSPRFRPARSSRKTPSSGDGAEAVLHRRTIGGAGASRLEVEDGSTMCSGTWPAMRRPSSTWPMRKVVMPGPWPGRGALVATSRTWLMPAGAGRKREETPSGRSRPRGRRLQRLDLIPGSSRASLRHQEEAAAEIPSRSPRSLTWRSDSSRDVEHRAVGAAEEVRHLAGAACSCRCPARRR